MRTKTLSLYLSLLVAGALFPLSLAPFSLWPIAIFCMAFLFSSIFQQSAKDILITSQLRSAMIFNKNIKATNYQIDTYKKKIYVYGIALTSDEKDLVISEAKEILDVEDVVASILLLEDLRVQRN